MAYHKPYKFVGFVVLTIFSFKKSIGQDSVGLKQLISKALHNNFSIKLAEQQLNIQTLNNDWGVAGAMPTVNIAANNTEQITSINQKFADPTKDVSKSGVTSNTLNAGVNASVVLYNGKRIVAQKQQLQALQKLSSSQLNAQIQQVIFQVSLLYYNMVKQHAYLQVIDSLISLQQQKQSLLILKKQNGYANDADVLQANMDIATAQQTKLQQQLQINMLLEDMKQLVNDSALQQVSFADSLAWQQLISEDSCKKSIKNNPQLLAYWQQIQANQWQQQAVDAQKYPTIRLNGGYNLASNQSAAGFAQLNQTFGPSLGLSLSIPLFGQNIKQQTKVAQVNTQIANLQYNQTLQQYLHQVSKWYSQFTSSTSQWQTAYQNYTYAKQLTNILMAKLQVGQANSVEVKNAFQTLESLAYQLIQIKFQAKEAELNIKYLQGVL